MANPNVTIIKGLLNKYPGYDDETPLLKMFGPDEREEDATIKFDIVDWGQGMAQDVAPGAETPLGEDVVIDSLTIEMGEIGEKVPVSYTELTGLREPGTQARKWVNKWRQQADQLRTRVNRNKEYKVGTLLTAGTVTVTLQGTSISKSYDFSIPGGNKITDSPLWSAHTTADPFTGIMNAIQTVYPSIGLMNAKKFGLCNFTTWNHMHQCDKVRSVVASFLNPVARGEAPITPEAVAAFGKPFHGLEDIFVMGHGYKNSAGTFVPYIADGKFIIFVPMVKGFKLVSLHNGPWGMLQEHGIVVDEYPDPKEPKLRNWTRARTTWFPGLKYPGWVIVLTVL